MSKPEDKKHQVVNTKDQTTPPEPVKVGYDVEPKKKTPDAPSTARGPRSH